MESWLFEATAKRGWGDGSQFQETFIPTRKMSNTSKWLPPSLSSMAVLYLTSCCAYTNRLLSTSWNSPNSILGHSFHVGAPEYPVNYQETAPVSVNVEDKVNDSGLLRGRRNLGAAAASPNTNVQEQQETNTKQDMYRVPQSVSSSSSSSRVLLGIVGTQSEADTARRKLIRKTYLSTFHVLNEVGLAEDYETVDRICSLSDLLNNKRNTVADCQLVYVFVLGAWDNTNTTALTDLTGISDPSFPYTVDRSSSENFEDDVLYLNIRENMNDGKTDTWFRYASTILPAESLGIDLIAKVDTDTVVFPKAFLDELDKVLLQQHGVQRPATSIYGGLSEIAHANEIAYMQGGFYFLSRDVAAHITSEACPRQYIVDTVSTPVLKSHGVPIHRAEDLEIGNFVELCWNSNSSSARILRSWDSGNGQLSAEVVPKVEPIRKVFLSEHASANHQPAWKKSDRFRVMWKDGRAREMAALRYNQIKGKYKNNCPRKPKDWEKELKWFDERPHMIQAKQHFHLIC